MGMHQMLLASGGTFYFTISANTLNGNLRTLAVNAGWDQSAKVYATINSGIYCYSNSTGTPGLTINGSFPGGVQLTNNGFITGMGGAGGYGAGSNNGYVAGQGGFAAGLALSVSSAVSIDNTSGTVGGGGGGGGGGSYLSQKAGTYGGGGGGGGRTGITNSAGGAGGLGTAGNGVAGTDGTSSAAGGGGAGGGAGGAGGAYGASGVTGATSTGFGGAGGGAGGAVTGNSNITWINTGVRSGSIT